MSEQKIQISELANSINKILTDYGEKVDKTVDTEAKNAMKLLVHDTKRDAPVNTLSGGKHYRDQISSKTLKSGSHSKSYLWYVNGDKYRIAHLLNNGHATRNGGRVPGDNHITNNAQSVVANYERKVKEAIENGS